MEGIESRSVNNSLDGTSGGQLWYTGRWLLRINLRKYISLETYHEESMHAFTHTFMYSDHSGFIASAPRPL